MYVVQTLYVQPVHPGQAAPVGTTQYETVRLQDDYKREIPLFWEVTDIEKAITKLIVQVIDEIYLKSLRNQSTNTIQLNLAQILDFFFDRWGIVNDEDIQAKESKCREMVYDLTEPILQIFD